MSEIVEIPIIDQDMCNGCGLCVNVCSCNSLVLFEDVITFVQTGRCGWCTMCEAVCPTGAIVCPYEIVFEQR
jgi:MinD superfamily P-loop ATPase